MIKSKTINLSFLAFILLTNNLVAKEETTTLEAITVTAQKKEENVQKVPISVSVFDEMSIEDKSIDSLEDIAKYTPNLMLYNTGQEGLIVPSIRGISGNVLSYSTPVGLYVDGVPTNSAFGFDDSLGDIERIEVLRGPQGTLYGKNSEAGVINIITKQPNNEIRGKISSTIGNEGRKDIGLNVSGPIIKDKFYVGVAYKHQEKDGFIKNNLTNEYVNDKKSDYGKLILRATPTDNLDVSLISSIHKENNGAHNWVSSTNNKNEVTSNLKGSSTPKDTTFALNVNYNIDENSKIKSITTKKEYKDKAVADADFSPLTLRHIYKNNELNTISQEFRYETILNKTQILSGIYLDKKDDDLHTKIVTPLNPTGFANPQDMNSKSIGVFTNIIHPLNEDWTLNAGIRYDKEKKEMQVKNTTIDLENSYNSVSPKIGIQYNINENQMSYFTIAKGYRSGGFNPYAPSNKQAYDEEKLISYELGYKGMFFDNRLKFNTNIYYMDIKDMQVEEAPIAGIIYMVNAATATSKGFEMELEGVISDELTMFASAGVNQTTFDKFEDLAGDYSGNYNPLAPKYNFNIGTLYRANNGLYARVDFNGYGKTYFDKANTTSQKAYNLVDTKIGYEANDFDIYFYVNNLFDKDYDAIGAYFSGTTTILRPEQEFGIKLAYRF
ncbi:TonB-dependent receptor [Aliarcobacter butzleri]|uniref:TonB-dependent receptor n=1 Tax=Aliarcobacter butzleri TaxID=28197 RepID=UPI00063B05DC|nr:TonB-dependent receptor [Aliarcobacter butzleri]KLE07703.1 TonB-denpendent receptor [Aliarcobacter butzleri L354]MCG3693982.1 TonB-dependent receptor [Aliarcobacter butzleri]MDN5072236.1 TonB-dependent receptor [Aliarcobacter butzleri]MDN5120873.1 TonB-dependent receptor [Aliarcobacter butzleri]MDN5129017.1 TonB-dependent receptor [Aliarcobacter butzleri]